jgi:transcription antitermination factor NusG
MLFASRTNKSILFVFSLLLLVAFMTACGNNENATKNEQEKEVAGLEETGKLVIYTSRKEELAKPVVEKFEKDTGIDVQALYSDGKVINKIAEEKNNVLNTDGVLNFVYYLSKPAVIKDEEVNNIRMYLADKDARISIISDEGFMQGEKIKINFGVFMDKEGTVLKGSKKKVFVQLQSLGQVMVVEFPDEYLSPI